MKDVNFFTFPRPDVNNDNAPGTTQCREWIKACGRPTAQLNLDKINKDIKNTYIITEYVQRYVYLSK